MTIILIALTVAILANAFTYVYCQTVPVSDSNSNIQATSSNVTFKANRKIRRRQAARLASKAESFVLNNAATPHKPATRRINTTRRTNAIKHSTRRFNVSRWSRNLDGLKQLALDCGTTNGQLAYLLS